MQVNIWYKMRSLTSSIIVKQLTSVASVSELGTMNILENANWQYWAKRSGVNCVCRRECIRAYAMCTAETARPRRVSAWIRLARCY